MTNNSNSAIGTPVQTIAQKKLRELELAIKNLSLAERYAIDVCTTELEILNLKHGKTLELAVVKFSLSCGVCRGL